LSGYNSERRTSSNMDDGVGEYHLSCMLNTTL
jgi:hypothetical protein